MRLALEELSVVQWVGSGLSLIAFIVAAALLAYRSRLRQQAQIIYSAQPEDRIDAISALAESFRVDISGLSQEQQEKIVLKQLNIRSRRELFIAIAGTVISISFFIMVFISIKFDKQNKYNTTVTQILKGGPATLQPGETRAFDIELGTPGAVKVFINNIMPDWTGRAAQKAEWKRSGKGNTPELWIRVCSSKEEQTCPDGVQKGISGTLVREISAGPATVIFFNFGTSPPVTFTTTVNYPG